MLQDSILKGIFIIVVIICVGYFILVILSTGSLSLPPENHSASYMYPLKKRIVPTNPWWSYKSMTCVSGFGSILPRKYTEIHGNIPCIEVSFRG